MRVKITILLSVLCLQLLAQKHEVRAVWLTTIGGIDWPASKSAVAQRRELTATLDQLQQAGVNTVLVQTRVRASTIYPSRLEPFDLCLTGTHGRSPGYDPLSFIVGECHRRGMECHAWVVTLPIGKVSEPRFREFRSRHPRMVRTIGQEGFMNPEDPATGDYLAQLCEEIVRGYDVDGIHLDYIRYPETWKLRVSRQQARQNITAIVRKIHRAVKTAKPWVKLSCSPIGKSGNLSRYRSGGWDAYNAVCQDAQGWMREGLMDQLYPMMYFRGNNFYPFALDWQERSCGRTVVAGLGIYFLSPREGNWALGDVTRELHFARQNGLGHCYFRSRFLTDNTRGIYEFVRHFDRYPALIPPMTWASTLAPVAPAKVSVQRGTKADVLAWSGARDRSGGPYLLYNIYASTTPAVDTADARNLIATRLQASELSVPHTPGQTLYYAVTALDRYGLESSAAFTDSPRRGGRGVPAPQLTPADTHIPPFYYHWSKKQRKRYDKTH